MTPRNQVLVLSNHDEVTKKASFHVLQNSSSGKDGIKFRVQGGSPNTGPDYGSYRQDFCKTKVNKGISLEAFQRHEDKVLVWCTADLPLSLLKISGLSQVGKLSSDTSFYMSKEGEYICHTRPRNQL